MEIKMIYDDNRKNPQLDKELFKNPTAEYRGAPFWAWNCELDKDELLRQIDIFKEMGLGGFHMHCREGMATEPMKSGIVMVGVDGARGAKRSSMTNQAPAASNRKENRTFLNIAFPPNQYVTGRPQRPLFAQPLLEKFWSTRLRVCFSQKLAQVKGVKNSLPYSCDGCSASYTSSTTPWSPFSSRRRLSKVPTLEKGCTTHSC